MEIPLVLVLKDAQCIDKPPGLGSEALDPQRGCSTAMQNPAASSHGYIDQIHLILAPSILWGGQQLEEGPVRSLRTRTRIRTRTAVPW